MTTYVPFYTKRRCQKGISKMQLWNASVTSIFCGSWKFRLHLMISITFGLQFAWFALWACLMKQVFQKDFVWIKLLKFQSMSIETESILRTTVNTIVLKTKLNQYLIICSSLEFNNFPDFSQPRKCFNQKD